MSYLGSWKIDDLLTFYANTTRFDTGAATDADAVPAYRVYEDETGTAILTGNMALIDSSNTAGFYSEQITLSAANGFEKGKSYTIYISAAVNSVTGATHHTLQIGPLAADLTQILGTAVSTPATAGILDVNIKNIDNDAASASGTVTFPNATLASTTNITAGTITTTTNPTNDPSGVTTLLSRLTSTRAGYLDNLSAGAVATAAKLLSYFQSALRKDVTVDADIGGNYDDATDSQEAIRDRGDAAWITATGFSTHSAADVWAVGTRSITVLDEDSTTLDLDATVRAAVGLTSANLDTQLDALPTAVENADALLNRDLSTGTDSGSATVRTVRQALRFLRNKWAVSGTTLTVYKEDDTTASWTATVSTDAAADPVTGNDPASS